MYSWTTDSGSIRGSTDTSRRARGLLLAGAAAYLGWRLLRGAGDDIRDQVVLITGGSRGLGLLMAKEFGAQGCRIAICARDEVELENAMREMREAGIPALDVRCDVSNREEVEAMVSRVTKHFGRIDILVNNAGIIQVGPIGSMTIDDFERAMNVMYWGSLHTIMAVLPWMIESGSGRIVNITSIGGKVAVPHLLPYDAAKFAQVALSEGLRAELKRFGIAVTTVVPGLMRTGSPVNALFKGDAKKEFTWFALASATPLTAMNAARAARRIVAATRRREAEVTLTWQAKALRIANGFAPGLMSDVMGTVAGLLPAGGGRGEHRGMHLATRAAPSPLTALMNRAARRNNELGGRRQPSRRHAKKLGISREERP
jgi:NAD(P)-dependent dehydrogenase (short-subunit alcohol dehydrogenase family)